MGKILMISGKSASGKDAVAKIIQEELSNKKILTIHFGDPVKWIARDDYNWNGEKNEQGRALLQYIGTTLMRSYNPIYWADIIAQYVAATRDQYDIVLIPDLRFKNEYNTVANYNDNIILIRVERYNEDGSLYLNPLMTYEQSHHISECELDNFAFHIIIENSGTLKDLQASVKTALHEINKGEYNA